MGGLPAAGPVGAAGGAGRQAQAGAGHGDRRLGVHPARRHGLLGQGRHRDQRPRRTASSTTRSAAWVRGPRGRRRRRAARRPQGDRRARAIEVDRGAGQGAAQPTSSSTPTQRRRSVSSRCEPKLAEAEQKRKAIEEQLPTTLVFREKAGEPKPAFLLKRGEYDQRGEKVGRGVPAFLPPLPPGAPVNRLGLAHWLVAPNHPLTARVAVNRFWLQVFGTGLVKTAEDFGAQGEPPSHPELLDWLAVTFREDGWDVKRLMKRLVMSATYRQSSRVTPRDAGQGPGQPAARRAGRGSGSTPRCSATRRSLPAGCWSSSVGGPSVKPPQPAGLWEAVGYTDSNTAQFKADRAPRRSTAAASTPSGSGPRRRRR